MALKVMLSSVRRGLADVRDSVAPVLKILRYDVIRFETVVTTTPAPPRAICVEMVETADIYLLILGDEYGDPMPGTDLAPTEEEWTIARNQGKPIVVFKKADIHPGPRQAAFIKRVEDYETGTWRHSFADAGDLISQLEAALSAAADALRPAAPSLLTTPVSVPWLETARGTYTGAGTVLETHVLPVGPTTPLPAASLGDLQRIIASAAQDHGAFELGQAIDFSINETGVIARARGEGRRPESGIHVGRNRIVSVWESLPSSHMLGVVLDEAQFAHRVARDLRIAAALGLLNAERVSIAVGFNDVSMLDIPTEFGNGIVLPFAAAGGGPVHLEPTDAWPLRALAIGADEIAREIVARLMLRLGRRT